MIECIYYKVRVKFYYVNTNNGKRIHEQPENGMNKRARRQTDGKCKLIEDY